MNSLSHGMQDFEEAFRDEQRDSGQQQAEEGRARYESEMVEEARAIVEGRSMKLATKEHLWVVLDWLDGARVRLNREQPEAEWDGTTPPF